MLFSDIWSENAAIFKKLMKIHSKIHQYYTMALNIAGCSRPATYNVISNSLPNLGSLMVPGNYMYMAEMLSTDLLLCRCIFYTCSDFV